MQIRDARPDEFEAAADLLAKAMRDDPGWSVVAPNPDTRFLILRILCGEAITMAQACGGRTWICEVDEQPAGVFIWNPPDQTSIPLSTYLMGLMRSLPSAVAHPVCALRTIRNIIALESIKPKQRMYYAVFLGCAIQGRGVGTRLVHHLIEECGPVDLYLETQNPANIAFYERLGFDRTETLEHTYKNGPSAFGFIHRAKPKLAESA